MVVGGGGLVLILILILITVDLQQYFNNGMEGGCKGHRSGGIPEVYISVSFCFTDIPGLILDIVMYYGGQSNTVQGFHHTRSGRWWDSVQYLICDTSTTTYS